MNPLATAELADVQAEPDGRGVALDAVGIDRLSYPIAMTLPGCAPQSTVAVAELAVSLPPDVRGTHMSRFVEALHDHHVDLGVDGPLRIARDLRERLGAETARAVLAFPLFFPRAAPVSGAEALIRVDCKLSATAADGHEELRVGARVAVTSLCPCSKEIAEYGAHSQRGYVDVEVLDGAWRRGAVGMSPRDLLAVADAAASAPIYPLLKRTDERHVTMAAYDRPAFVEDLARDVAVALRDDDRVDGFTVAVANEESIHDHRAVARVSWSRE